MHLHVQQVHNACDMRDHRVLLQGSVYSTEGKACHT